MWFEILRSYTLIIWYPTDNVFGFDIFTDVYHGGCKLYNKLLWEVANFWMEELLDGPQRNTYMFIYPLLNQNT